MSDVTRIVRKSYQSILVILSVAGCLTAPAAVTVNVACANMQGAQATSVPLFDVAGFANPVAWTFTATNTGGKDLRLREEDGKLLLDLLPGGLTVIFR